MEKKSHLFPIEQEIEVVLIMIPGWFGYRNQIGKKPKQTLKMETIINQKRRVMKIKKRRKKAAAHILDQETTDFQKCLAVCDADIFLGVGFLGGRLDHQLAAFSTLLNEPRPVVLIDEAQLVFVVPLEFSVDLEAETPVGFYPMVSIEASLRGVRWPLSNAAMSPIGQIATSNVALGGALEITVDGPGLLAIMPRRYLVAVLAALDRGFGKAHHQ